MEEERKEENRMEKDEKGNASNHLK